MKKKPFFISAATYSAAREIAKEHGFTPGMWKYVPIDKKLRFMAISGHHEIPKENLIGSFTEEEIIYLTIEKPKPEEVEDPEIEEKRAETVICKTSDNGLEKEEEKKQNENGTV